MLSASTEAAFTGHSGISFGVAVKSPRPSRLAAALLSAVSVLVLSSNSRATESTNTTSVRAQASPLDAAAVLCIQIGATDFTGIEDAPTQITESKSVPKTDDLPSYCQVLGYVWPQVGFDLRLPDSGWNGKFMQIGCHSNCGAVTIPMDDCRGPLRRGYACVTTDMGHRGAIGSGLWAYNNLQGKVDWGYRGTHVVAVAAKAITSRYYGRRPAHSYFAAWSAGTRQGMVEAQRFPWDFDGIICGTGQIDWLGAMMTGVWIDRISHDAQGQPVLRLEDLRLLHAAALARCDGDDGLKDGIIGNPRSCSFDPSELLCHGNATKSCLTEVQLEVVKKYYSGPLDSKGAKVYPEGAMMPGSELSWPLWSSLLGSTLGVEVFRYAGFDFDPGVQWNIRDFDFDEDYKRLGTMETLYSGTNPDLRKFKEAGGKLIFWQGWAEVPAPPLSVIQYYEAVERLMGGRAPTQDFFRLFMIPGLGHVTSEGGISPHTIDFLTHLEDWVEKGMAPQRVVGARLKAPEYLDTLPKFPLDANRISFTRPIYPYPMRAKYSGRGDPNDAANFVPEVN